MASWPSSSRWLSWSRMARADGRFCRCLSSGGAAGLQGVQAGMLLIQVDGVIPWRSRRDLITGVSHGRHYAPLPPLLSTDRADCSDNAEFYGWAGFRWGGFWPPAKRQWRVFVNVIAPTPTTHQMVHGTRKLNAQLARHGPLWLPRPCCHSKMHNVRAGTPFLETQGIGDGRQIDFRGESALMPGVTATLEQTQADLARLVSLAQQGEEVVITSQGRAVARLTGVPSAERSPGRQAWLAKLARLRESTATGKTSPTTEQILDDLRSERG